MQNVDKKLLGVDNLGNQQMMYPNQDYHFPGASHVTEYPILAGKMAVNKGYSQQGGPIITNDPNDPRLKAYQDSLNSYNYGVNSQREWLKTHNDAKVNETIITPIEPPCTNCEKKKYSYKDEKGRDSHIRPLTVYNEEYNPRPLNFKEKMFGNKRTAFIGQAGYVDFKKPVQPVAYQAKQEKKLKTREDYRKEGYNYVSSDKNKEVWQDGIGGRVEFPLERKPVSKPKPVPSPIKTREAIPGFGEEQKPYDSIMMPSGQRVTKEQFIKQYGMDTWTEKYGKRKMGGAGGSWTGPRPWNVRVDKNDSGGLKYGGSSDDCFPDPVSFPEERKNDFLKFLRETSLDKVKESLMNEHQEFVNQFQSGGQASKDSLNHQRDKIIKYEQTRGSEYGTPLPQYLDTAYYNKYWEDNVVPQLTPYSSAIEKGEAGDFIFNSGKDPKKYAYQEYLRKSSGTDWDERNSTDSLTIDSLYKNTVSKLPENDRRIMMNKGRDWYYKHINNGPNGELSPAYDNTWYGRIWNTNDYKDFDPNNPKFTPRKQYGGTSMMQATGDPSENFGYTVDNRSPFFDPYNNNVPLDVKKQKRRNNSPYNPPWDFIPNTGQKWQPHTDMSWMDTQQASDPNKLDYSPQQGFPQGQSFGMPPKQGAFNLNSDQYNMENVNQRASKASGEGITGRPNWKDRWWADPDLINAGMEGATNIINNLPGGANDRLKKWQKKTTTADWFNPLTQGSRGDYTTNSGYFRPDQMTPIQFPGAAGFQHYQEGGEVYLGDSEAEQLRNQGYELQEID